MEVVLWSLFVVYCVGYIVSLVIQYSAVEELSSLRRRIGTIEGGFNETNFVLGGINAHAHHVVKALTNLTQEPNELALHVLKDSFLSRKDNEGIMLVEAVEKQLKKRRKAQPKPV